jgi:CRISPR-associated protein Cas1
LKPMYLSGFGVSLNVDKARLLIRDGHHDPDAEPAQYAIQPRDPDFDSVIVDSQSGMISLTAVKWLMRHGIPLFVLDYNGTILSSMLPRDPTVGNLKKAQLETYLDSSRRLHIAKKILETKFQRTFDVINWLSSRYDIPNQIVDCIHYESDNLNRIESIDRLLASEARVAETYWRIWHRILPEKYGFDSRIRSKHQNNASDKVNVLLNYGYSFLESRCRKALNSVGLEPTIGFLHEIRQTKYALVYDLQEPFRWLVDATVISCLEQEKFSRKDFFRMDNYVMRLTPDAVKRFLELLRTSFNSTLIHEGRNYQWDTIIQLKAQELANYILGRNKTLDFTDPHPNVAKEDSKELRERIRTLSTSDARKLGIRKNTLWYLKRRASDNRALRIYSSVSEKLAATALTQ